MNKILITGSTGEYGRNVVESLIRKGTNPNFIYAFVRDEVKARYLGLLGVNLVFGDYNNYDSMLEAFSGINKLLFVSSGEMRNRSGQHLQVVRAARKAGVKHIFYTSQVHKTDSVTSAISFIMKSHLATEAGIMKSGMDFTILRNGLYLDMLPMFLGDKVLESGIISLPAGEGRIVFTLRSEMAETAAMILCSEGHENRVYEISDSSISFTEIAAIISQITDKKITYISTDLHKYINTAINSGVPKKLAQMLGSFAEAAREKELEGRNSQMEKLLGRKPTNVAEFLRIYIDQSRSKEK